jgi:hypothetical protein
MAVLSFATQRLYSGKLRVLGGELVVRTAADRMSARNPASGSMDIHGTSWLV